MIIAMIACVARNGVIGRDGAMPWSMPSDLKHFRQMTLGKPIIMGRKTFQSIGRALPGRRNIVVTGQLRAATEGIEWVRSLDAALVLARANDVAEVVIIGGGELYQQGIAIADRLYVTALAVEVPGDTTFPRIDPQLWQEQTRAALLTGPHDDYPADLVTYERRPPVSTSTVTPK